MKKIVIAIITFASLCLGTSAQNSDPQKAEDQIKAIIQNRNPSLNSCAVTIYCNDSKQHLEAAYKAQQPTISLGELSGKYNQLLSATGDARKLDAAMQQAIKSSTDRADQANIAFGTLKFTNGLKNKIIEEVPVAGPIYAAANEKLFDYLGEKLKESQREELKRSLDVIKDKSLPRYTELMQSKDISKIKTALEEVGYFNNSNTTTDPEQSGIINDIKTKMLTNIVQQGLGTALSGVIEHGQDLKDLHNQVNALAGSFYQMEKQNNETLKSVVDQQKELKTDLEAFHKQYNKDQEAVKFLQGFMFDKMQPDEKLAALKGGLLQDMDPAKRSMLQKEIEIEAKRQKIMNTVGTYLNSAQNCVTILNNLHIGGNSPILKDIESGVAIGSTVFAAAQQFASGNYLGALASFTGLFGSKTDPAAERHKQVMESLNRIEGKIDVLDEKMNQLIKGQEQMLNAQVETYNAIVNLSRQVADEHDEVMKKLDELQDDVLYNRGLILENVINQCDACKMAINQLRINNFAGQLTTPQYLRVFLANYGGPNSKFSNCKEFLNMYVISQDLSKINKYYYMESYIPAGDNNAKRSYKNIIAANKSMTQAVKYSGNVLKLTTTKQKIFSLLFPATSVKELQYKINTDSIWIAEDKQYDLNTDLMNNLIAPEACKVLDSVLINMHFVLSMMDNSDRVITTDDLAKPEYIVRTLGYDYLKIALRLTNLGIAQQNLLSGDFMLHDFYSLYSVSKLSVTDSARIQSVNAVFNHNSILTQNFLKYSISTFLKDKSFTISQYQWAYDLHDSSLMRQVVKLHVPFVYLDSARAASVAKQKGWYAHIDNAYHPLPTPEETRGGELTYTTPIYELMALRNKLIREIESYDIYKLSNDSQRISISYTIAKATR